MASAKRIYSYLTRVIVPIALCNALFNLLQAGVTYAEQQAEAYRIGPEDTINISVARHPELSGDFYVPSDGVINIPAVGELSAKDKTAVQISSDIINRLQQRLREPEVTVILKTPRMQRIYVLGAVDKPGLYDAKPGWRTTEAIAAAGGLVKGTEATDCEVSILRAAKGERQNVKLSNVLHGDPQANMILNSGDVVTVDVPETLPVYVVGKVKNPGLYKIRRDTSGVVEALTLASGTLEDAALDRVSITHLNGSSETIDLAPSVIGGKHSQSKVVLQPGDMITVPEETSRIAVLGYVNEPGFYPLRNGRRLNLTDALGMAKGVDNKKGDTGSVAIIRDISGKQEKLIVDMRKFLKTGDPTQNPEIKSGDVVYVPQSSKPDWDRVISSLTAVGILINPILP